MMEIGASRYDDDLGWVPCIPLPFYVWSWRYFRSVPACYQCRMKFKTQAQWEAHWVLAHLQEQEARDGA